MKSFGIFLLAALVLAGGIFLVLRAPDANAELIPYSVGTIWTYQVEQRNEQGEVENTMTDTSRVAGEEFIEGQRWFMVEEFGYEFWVRIGDEGGLEAELLPDPDPESKGFVLQRKQLFFKYPAKKGETYPVGDPDFKQQAKVVETDLKVDVPAGSFQCMVYEISTPEALVSRISLAPGIGIVKFEFPSGYGESELPETRELITIKTGDPSGN